MSNYANEFALAWCAALNIFVFAAAYRFARHRTSGDRISAAIDACLLDYTVQYLSICLPGGLGALRAGTMSATAVLISAMLWLAGGKRKTAAPLSQEIRSANRMSLAVALFTAAYVLSFAVNQRFLPVMSNDAMTYHFPGAVQWLQTGRLDVFQVWFFNPANTFSPLAGSTFIAWLLAPFGNDVLARFVQLPALLFTGLCIFQICRRLGVEHSSGALLAATVILSRPFFFPAIMGKDDLFVVAFFLCALLALTGAEGTDRFGNIRAGLAVGLLMAVKYSAVISAIPLLLVIDRPIRARWRARHGAASLIIAAIIAGPWYLRTLLTTGNPVFPIQISAFGIRIFRGLFTMSSSESLHDAPAIWNVLTGGNYGLPAGLFAAAALGWIVALVLRFKSIRSNSLLRACLLGPPLGILLFVGRSPFPEVRFVLPSFALLFVSAAVGIGLLFKSIALRRSAGVMLMAATVFTAFVSNLRPTELELGFKAVIVAGLGIAVGSMFARFGRRGLVVTICAAVPLSVGWVYVNWSAYVEGYRSSRFLPTAGWAAQYPQNISLWQYCQEQIPADSTLAYTNLYIVYPLQGFSLDRRLIYAPARPAIGSQADLPWLGDHLTGERLIPAASAATVQNPQKETWLKNLRRSGATYLIIGKSTTIALPPEAQFAAADPARFHKLFESDGGIVYSMEEPPRP